VTRPFDGLAVDLGNLHRLSSAQTRSITPENPTGAKGAGGMAETGTMSGPSRDLGRGWKINPWIPIQPGETATLADVEGAGAIQHIWMTLTPRWRSCILRIHWDDQEAPSVECPVSDFFAMGWNEYAPLSSLAVCVNPGSAFNCYWPMPFRQRCRITLENRGDKAKILFYQVDYALGDVPDDAAYFHAQFRRSNPVAYAEPYTLLDGVRGCGHYAGTYLAWGSNSTGWWGEGEVKFYLDGDGEFPTLCGTGTEDYFCGSYNFENQSTHEYEPYCTPYAGLHQVIRPDGLYRSQQRFGMYRWHIPDPVRFQEDVRVTVQALGWRSGRRYLPLRDDLASVAYWYQTLPTAAFPPLPDRDACEVT
jgi:hypothetical protein